MATLHSNTCPICGRAFEWKGDTPPETCPFCFASISIETENNTQTDMDDTLGEPIDEEAIASDDAPVDDSADDTEQFIKEMLGGFSDDSEEDLLAKIKQEILNETQAQAADDSLDKSEPLGDNLEEITLEEVDILETSDAAVQDTVISVDEASATEQENVSFAEDIAVVSEDEPASSTDEPMNADVEETQEIGNKDIIALEETGKEASSSKPTEAKEDVIEEISSATKSEDIDIPLENEVPKDNEGILDIASIEELIAEETAVQDGADGENAIDEIDIFEALAQEAMQKDISDADLSTEDAPSFEAKDNASVENTDVPQPDIHNLAAAMQAEGEPVRRRVVRRNMNEDMPSAEETPRTTVRKRAPAEAAASRKQKRVKAQKKRGALKYYIIAAAAVIVVFLAGYFGFLKPMGHYNKGVAYAAEGENLLALSEFTKAGGYSDATTKVKDILAPYRGQAIAFEDHFAAEGKYAAVQNNLGQVYYANFETHTDPTVAQGDVSSFVIYKGFVVAVRATGGVAFSNLTTTDNPVPDLQGWESVQTVQILSSTLVGTKEDGSYITSDNVDVSRLIAEDILTVNDTLGMFGVTKEGTVSVPNALEISTKKEAETLVDTVGKWKDIVLVEGTPTTRIVGLTATGRVKVAPAISKDTSGADKTSGWRNIVDVASGQYHTVGLQADGTVVATGNNDYGQCNVSEWTDIIAIEAGNLFTIGIKKDGTVLVTSKTGPYIPVNFVDVYIPEPIIFEDTTPDDTDPDAASSDPVDSPTDADSSTDADGTDTTDPNTSDTGDGADTPTDTTSPSPSTDAGE